MAVDGIAKFVQLYIYGIAKLHELQPNDNQLNVGPSKEGLTRTSYAKVVRKS